MTALAGRAWLLRVLHSSFLADVRWRKPGNVSRASPGHGMTAAHFEHSAGPAAAALVDAGPGVGERVRAAVAATRSVVDCNTNLGILLLAAPLVEAALDPRGDGSLESRLEEVLARLGRGDAAAAFAAIRTAAPGGLGRSERHDVAGDPDCTLREAMAEAADRDLVARQYASGYADVLGWGVPALVRALRENGSRAAALAELQLGFVSRFPDSHVRRKHGMVAAEALRDRAREVLLGVRADPGRRERRIAEFDAVLKGEGLNPGTSADLTVATLVAFRLARRAEQARLRGKPSAIPGGRGLPVAGECGSIE